MLHVAIHQDRGIAARMIKARNQGHLMAEAA
jgi:hypothetical protein